MLNTNLNAQQGFHQHVWGSPEMRYPQNRYYIVTALSEGAKRGDWYRPLHRLKGIINSYPEKGIIRAIFLVFIPHKDPHSII